MAFLVKGITFREGEGSVSNQDMHCKVCSGDCADANPAMIGCPRDTKDRPLKESEHCLVASALYDFIGFLTTSEEERTFSSKHSSTMAVDALAEWADRVGLSLSAVDMPSWRRAVAQKYR